MDSTPKKREFVFNGMKLEDPDPSMPPEKVCEFYSPLYAELTNARSKGPTVSADGTEQYKFEMKVGNFG